MQFMLHANFKSNGLVFLPQNKQSRNSSCKQPNNIDKNGSVLCRKCTEGCTSRVITGFHFSNWMQQYNVWIWNILLALAGHKLSGFVRRAAKRHRQLKRVCISLKDKTHQKLMTLFCGTWPLSFSTNAEAVGFTVLSHDRLIVSFLSRAKRVKPNLT